MKSRYPLVRLGELLRPDGREVEVEVRPDVSYQLVGVYSYGRGLFSRPSIRGSDTSYRTLFRLSAGHLVVARLNAWEGAVSVVRAEFAGKHVSREFPVFSIETREVEPGYIAWLARWPPLWAALADRTQGSMVRRRRVQPDDVLAVKVPVPPDRDEQRRVVERIESIARRASAAEKLDAWSRRQLGQVLPGAAHRADLGAREKRKRGWREFAMAELLSPAGVVNRVAVDETYPNFGILSFGRGAFRKPPIDGARTSAKELFRVRSGQFIYSRLFAFEGAFGRVPDSFDGWFVSSEFPAFDSNDRLVTSEFLAAYFQAPSSWAAVAESIRGLGLRRQRLQPEQLLAHRLFVPPRHEQNGIKAALHLVDRVGALRDQQKARLDSLVPSVLNSAFSGEL